MRRAEGGDEVIPTGHGQPAVRRVPAPARPDPNERRLGADADPAGRTPGQTGIWALATAPRRLISAGALAEALSVTARR